MDIEPTHILVPLQTWYTIKNHVAILEQKGSEVLAMSQKGCDVNEISGVVNNLMETVNKDIAAFCTYESEAPEFEEAAEVHNSVPKMFPQMQAASIPEVLKKHPVQPASPPPRALLVKAHGPFACKVLPQKKCPWHSSPYSKDSSGTSSSSTASTWNTNEYWK